MSVDLSPEERAKIVAERADVKYGPFASLHEAYGVLAEEMAERDAEVMHYNDIVNTANNSLVDFMIALRGNSTSVMAALAADLRENELKRAEVLRNAGDEIIDVIAVCDRIIAQWGEKS